MTHYVVIHALMKSRYPRRRTSNPKVDFMMDIDPLKSLGMVEVVEQTDEGPWHVKEVWYFMKKTWRNPWTHTWWCNDLATLVGSWSSCMMMMIFYGLWKAMEPMNMSLASWRIVGSQNWQSFHLFASSKYTFVSSFDPLTL